jgi:monoamine oxidase
LRQGKLTENPRFWEELKEVFERINPATPDQDFQSFLDQAWSMSPRARMLAREFVEGFHAADPSHISIHSLAQAEAAAEEEKGTRIFRLAGGYSELLRWLWNELSTHDVQFHMGTVAKLIRWEPGQAQVLVRSEAGERAITGRAVVITVPLSVLREEGGEGFLTFEPGITKEKAIHGLEMGAVCKVTLQFKTRFWPPEDFGFIQCADRSFPTWWSHPRGNLLTGWAGGPRAQRLSAEPREAVISEALRAVSVLFKIEQKQIEDSLSQVYFYNWETDPFSLGAYSFIPARMSEMPRLLGMPIEGTLFFAGEATDSSGDLCGGAKSSSWRPDRHGKVTQRGG